MVLTDHNMRMWEVRGLHGSKPVPSGLAFYFIYLPPLSRTCDLPLAMKACQMHLLWQGLKHGAKHRCSPAVLGAYRQECQVGGEDPWLCVPSFC